MAASSSLGKISSRTRQAAAFTSLEPVVASACPMLLVIFMPVSFSSMSPTTSPRRSYDASRRREQAAATRQRIVEAAAALFVERGYTGATVPAIAAAAEV